MRQVIAVSLRPREIAGRRAPMLLIRILCIIIFAALALYTLPVIQAEPNLFPAFFGAITAGGWQGQFNLDFVFMLTLSGLWVAWRHRFSSAGVGLGLLAFLGGAMFLSVYLFILSRRCRDVQQLLTNRP
jgi:hypothetical protein